MIGGFFQLENIKIPVCIIHHSCNDFWWRLLKMRDWSPHTALWRFLRTWQNKLGRTCLNINLHSDPLRRRPWDEGVLVTMLWPYLMSSLIHPWKKIRVNWNMILCTATEKKIRISQRSIYGPNSFSLWFCPFATFKQPLPHSCRGFHLLNPKYSRNKKMIICLQ